MATTAVSDDIQNPALGIAHLNLSDLQLDQSEDALNLRLALSRLSLPRYHDYFNFVRQRDQGGDGVDYLPHGVVADAMDFFFAGRWDYEVVAINYLQVASIPWNWLNLRGPGKGILDESIPFHQIDIHGRVTCWDEQGTRVHRDALGQDYSLSYTKKGYILNDKGTMSAESNAFKRACAKIGPGRELYVRDDTADKAVAPFTIGDVLLAHTPLRFWVITARAAIQQAVHAELCTVDSVTPDWCLLTECLEDPDGVNDREGVPAVTVAQQVLAGYRKLVGPE